MGKGMGEWLRRFGRGVVMVGVGGYCDGQMVVMVGLNGCNPLVGWFNCLRPKDTNAGANGCNPCHKHLIAPTIASLGHIPCFYIYPSPFSPYGISYFPKSPNTLCERERKWVKWQTVKTEWLTHTGEWAV